MRTVVIKRLELFGLAKIMAAFWAEFAIGRYVFAASRTGEFELCPALLTELKPIRQLDITPWALHGFPHNVERGGLVEPLVSKQTQ